MNNKLKRWSKYLVISVAFIALLVLSGWEFNIDFFKHPLPGSKAMNPVAAITFILSSITFFILTSSRLSTSKKYAGFFLAALISSIGLLNFLSLFPGLDFHIDRILFPGKVNTDRIVPAAAFSFMLMGINLLLVNARSKKGVLFINTISLIIACIGFFSILGYLYRVKIFYGWLTYLPMAIHAAACFIFLSLAVLLANPEKGIMKIFTGSYAGSITARRLIPAAIIVPVLLGYLRMVGFRSGIFTTEFGTAILVLSIILVFIATIWYSVNQLNKRDIKNRQSEKALYESEIQIQTIFNAAPDGVIMIDEEGKIVKWNPKAEILFGWKAEEITGIHLSETIIPNRYR
ncbi:MAG TPA: PAS domain-containing protein, partial [Chitinophagaceae bacterium]|nr:PAS domain-containing protein [Chitinophagaceae bacterium]